jgi:hypothetical protein
MTGTWPNLIYEAIKRGLTDRLHLRNANPAVVSARARDLVGDVLCELTMLVRKRLRAKVTIAKATEPVAVTGYPKETLELAAAQLQEWGCKAKVVGEELIVDWHALYHLTID